MNSSATAPDAPPASRAKTAGTLFIGGGALLLLTSACVVLAFMVIPFTQNANALSVNTALLSVAAILIGYGALLLAIGRGLRHDSLRAPFWLPSPWIFLGALCAVLVLGQLVLTLNVASAYLFPIWHVLASLLFPLAVLAYATQRLARVSTRSVLAQFTWGGLVTIGLALVLELIIGGVLALLALLGIAFVLGPGAVNEIAQALRTVPTDMERVAEIIFEKPFSAVIAGSAAFLMIVILVPLLEELLKSTGAAFLMFRRVRAAFLPARGNAILWGLAAGAGYAFSENMLNGQGTLNNPDSLTGIWASAMILRAGTSLMHMIATATVCVGWYEALVAHKRARLPLLLAAAVLAHAIWNTSALLLAGVSMTRTASVPLASVSTILTVLVLGLLGFLFAGGLFWLRALIRWAQRAPVSSQT